MKGENRDSPPCDPPSRKESSLQRELLVINQNDIHKPEMDIVFKHEFRHAMWNTMHRREAKGNKLSSNPYLPHTDAEKEKLKSMLAKGERRVEELFALLKREESGKISPEERKQLQQLRKNSAAEYNKYYKISTDFIYAEKAKFPPNHIAEIEKQLGKKLSEKTRFFLPGHGVVTIKKIYPTLPDGSKALDIELDDPLYAAVYQIKHDISHIQNKHTEAQLLYEREAYLFSFCGRSIRKYLYPELVEYTDRLIKIADKTLSTQRKYVPDYLSVHELKSTGILETLKDPDFYDKAQVPFYIEWANYAVSMGDLDAAKMGLQKLIAHKDRVSEAHLALAKIYNQEGDYVKAAAHLSTIESLSKEIKQKAAKIAGISEEERRRTCKRK